MSSSDLDVHKLIYEDTGGVVSFPKIKLIGWVDCDPESKIASDERLEVYDAVKNVLKKDYVYNTEEYLLSEIEDEKFSVVCVIDSDIAFKCKLCGASDIPSDIPGLNLLTEEWFFVPDDLNDVLYRVPVAILHYIDEHGYKPPNVFLGALSRFQNVNEYWYDDDPRLIVFSGTTGHVERDSVVLDMSIDEAKENIDNYLREGRVLRATSSSL